MESATEQNQAGCGGLGCYSILSGRGPLMRGHWNRDPKTVREGAKQRSGRRGFRVEATSEKVQERARLSVFEEHKDSRAGWSERGKSAVGDKERIMGVGGALEALQKCYLLL